MAQAHAGGAELLVLSGREAPELKELTNLPDGMRLLATGRPGQELAGIPLTTYQACATYSSCRTGAVAPDQQQCVSAY